MVVFQIRIVSQDKANWMMTTSGKKSAVAASNNNNLMPQNP